MGNCAHRMLASNSDRNSATHTHTCYQLKRTTANSHISQLLHPAYCTSAFFRILFRPWSRLFASKSIAVQTQMQFTFQTLIQTLLSLRLLHFIWNHLHCFFSPVFVLDNFFFFLYPISLSPLLKINIEQFLQQQNGKLFKFRIKILIYNISSSVSGFQSFLTFVMSIWCESSTSETSMPKTKKAVEQVLFIQTGEKVTKNDVQIRAGNEYAAEVSMEK